MFINEEFLDLIMHKKEINKKQAFLLDLEYPLSEDFQTLLLNKEISQEQTNLLLLLKGDFSLKSQTLLEKNYLILKNFSKQNKTVKASKNIIEEKKEINENKNIEEKNSLNKIDIYCDGACSNNPGLSGSGLAVYKNKQKPILLYGKFLEKGTNNTAELQALLKALQIAKNNISTFEISIFSDSKYSIDCISTWAYSWKNKNWTKKSGEIKNLELIKEAHFLYDEIKDKLILKHVKAHVGIQGNELADRMAMYTIKAKNEEFEEYSYTSIQEVLDFKRG